MRKLLALSIGLLPLLTGVGIAHQTQRTSPPVATFSALSGNDVLNVVFTSSGCFHQARYEMRFYRKGNLFVQIVQIIPERVKGDKVETRRKNLGTLTLTAKDAEQLDALVTYYRNKPSSGCTTIDVAEITQKRGQQILAKEIFIDGSCNRDRTDILHLDALVLRLTHPETDPVSATR